jgi:hypothetical protein
LAGRLRTSGLDGGAIRTGFTASFFFDAFPAAFLIAFLTGFFAGLVRRDVVFFFFILAMAELRFGGLGAGETLMNGASASKMDAALCRC